nr:reverse transcriptase domain-containing protein [Tanacetum cinerariifolium]
GRNIVVYVDDLVVKSHTEAEMVRDIEETKISVAVSDLKKCIKKSDFRWTAEAKQAFQQLKQHLSDLPLLVAPNPQEELIMYLSATDGAVSTVLMTKRGTTQTPIYFISRALQVPSTVHGMLKFPVEGGLATIRSTILIPTECASVTTLSVTPREKRTHPANFTVALHPDFPDQDVQPSDMTEVSRSVVEHRLNIREGYTPARQKKKGQAPERARAIQAEVQKLVDARIMREVYYHDWLSNPVMVKKHDGSWRMCVDFTDLNRACPQDCYPLPKIDWKVESLCGYPFKCFLDAYKGYHQIQLAEVDEEKTAFHIGHGVYCYTKMPFGLKNVGATYQRLMDKAFEGRVGRNIEVYVDDLVVKSHTEAEMVRDIEETVLQLPSPQTVKEVQSLNEKLASLNRKISAAVSDLKKCIKRVTSVGLRKWSKRAGLILTNPEGVEFTYALRYQFAASNNKAEYEALVAGLRIATQMGVKNIQVNVDSKVVANQVLGTKNKQADALSKIASTSFAHLSKQVLVEVPENKSIKEKEVAAMIEEDGPTWMTQLADYLKEGVLLGDNKEARKLRLKARQYELREGVLCRRSPISGGAEEGQVLDSRNGLLHEVGRSQGEIILDNGKQFADNPFKDWCDKLNITQRFALVKHPQSNGLVERANRSLREGIKARLGEGNKNWVEELPHVL